MSEAFDEAQELLQCKSCAWYKNCIMPIRVSEEDLKKQIGTSMHLHPNDYQGDSYGFLSSIASAAQNSLLEGCPVLINRLRNNPRLAVLIKKVMQEWTKSEEQG
jgi:hypothetical protein